MFAKLFKAEMPDEDTIAWLFDTYQWAISNFNAEVFFDETQLVTPTNDHFPGTHSSVHDAAVQVFEQVKALAGLQHWPCEVMDQNSCTTLEAPKVLIEGALRGHKGITPTDVPPDQKLVVTYDSTDMSDPEVMIANYAHVLAHYLGSMSKEAPPGGLENWPHITEVLAVFMGFGIMFSNSALKFKGGCGSCGSHFVDRENYLSERDITYALAIFCQLKNIPARAANKHLKKSLRGYFSQAMKHVASHSNQLEKLRHMKP